MEKSSTSLIAHDASRGAAASVIASVVMKAMLTVARRAGLLGEEPPRKLTRKLSARVGIPVHGPALSASAFAAHVAYGSMIGAVAGPAIQRLRERRGRVLAGAATGAAVWTASYAGWIPALDLMARPTKDTPRSRPWVMFGAHLLFGGVLGACLPGKDER